ncbi:TPA: hypothetical protein ACWZ8K_004715, partial [Escherichia coli]
SVNDLHYQKFRRFLYSPPESRFPSPVSPGSIVQKYEKTPVSVTSGRQFVRDSHGCIDMHEVKIYQVRSRRFFGWFVVIFTCLLP